ncbi:DUF551 domain-containing protein [Hymenobacter sp. GOD-10R]|uniref:DUF551 domain-containing protein n=1 Tax=Hymenobacter sp. GOD-10R TaxID=3093922 RepID=UPI002D79BB90|nr:DUF551 domain-containing protein [Hymenobacter sp. GOD-10R]WRQ26702.1 DUF551 domain-containing protein [Hymenobacter sp. GOD-10R]
MNTEDFERAAFEAANKEGWHFKIGEPNLSEGGLAVACYTAGYNAAVAQIEKLQAFKDYVHGRLDQQAVDAHEEQNAINGCRIGARLDDVFHALQVSVSANALLLNERKAQAWISVTELLPVDEVHNHENPFGTTLYLVARPAQAYVSAHALGYRYDGDWYIVQEGAGDEADFIDNTVTHWMPLPAAPSQKGGQDA